MQKNDKQYTIYIRSTRERIPVTKEEFDLYYHDINIYRIRQQRHGCCVCPANKRLACDMDCLTCLFYRVGDMRSLDYIGADADGEENLWLDELTDSAPLLDEAVADRSEMQALYERLTELMPEALEIGRLRLEGKSDMQIASLFGLSRQLMNYRLKRVKNLLKKEFPEFF